MLEKVKNTQVIISDVDRVLTDGALYLTDGGEEIKAFNSHDGYGMKMLKASGVKLAIITARKSRCVKLRAENLVTPLIFQGIKNKLQVFKELLKKLGLDASACAYMVDDLIDLPVMLSHCDLSICVPAAPALVKKHAHYVTRLEGEHGWCGPRGLRIRNASTQGTLDAQFEAYLI